MKGVQRWYSRHQITVDLVQSLAGRGREELDRSVHRTHRKDIICGWVPVWLEAGQPSPRVVVVIDGGQVLQTFT